MENQNDIQELEALRKEYQGLKSRIEEQEIVNERLLRKTFATNIHKIESVKRISILCGILVILVSPFAFHYNPAMNLSWWFVLGTDLMMVYCIVKTYLWHRDVKDPSNQNQNLLESVQSIKQLKERYQRWLRYCYLLIVAWVGWMFAELYLGNGQIEKVIGISIGIIVGGLIGGIIGYRMSRGVIKNCDVIIRDIEDMEAK